MDAAALTIQDRFVPAANLPNNFYEVRQARSARDRRGDASSWITTSPRRTASRVSYFYLTGTDTQPLSGSGNIPWVDRDFKWTQHNLNVADTWTLSPTIINQLRVSYMRQFGGRVNNPTTSLGDLNSKFTIQGDPTLPRLTVSGYFTGQVAIAGPDAGSDYFAVKDSLSMSRGNHSFKFGGEVSYEKIVHDTLLDNYGVFTFNGSKTGNAYADFLLGLPATMTQDAPVRKTDNGAYISLFAQDDFRIHPRVTLNLGAPLRPAVPVHGSRESQAGLRARRAVAGVADGAGRPAVSRRPRHQPRHRQDRHNNIAPRLGIAWDPRGDGRMSVRAAAGVFYGSITGNEWNTTADNQPFTVRQPFPTVKTLSDPYGNLPGGVGPFPFIYDPASPRFTLPAQVFGPSLDFVWPYTYQMNLTIEKEIVPQLLRDAPPTSARSDASCPPASTGTIRCSDPAATTANVNARRPYMPGTIGQARVLESTFTSDYHGLQLSAERRGSRFSVEGLLHVRQGHGGRRLPGRRPAGGAELEPDRARARAHVGRSHAQLRALGRLEPRLLRRFEGAGEGAARTTGRFRRSSRCRAARR